MLLTTELKTTGCLVNGEVVVTLIVLKTIVGIVLSVNDKSQMSQAIKKPIYVICKQQ